MTTATPQAPALPPGIVLYQMAVGHYVSRALHLAAKLGIADLLANGARSAGEVAQATGTHAASLRRVLRLLASVGVFDEQESGSFALTPLGEALRSDVPFSSRASVMLFAGVGIQDSWKELEYCVRTGQPAFRKTSPDGDAFSHMDPEQAKVFDAEVRRRWRSLALIVKAKLVAVDDGISTAEREFLADTMVGDFTVYQRIRPELERARQAITGRSA